MRPAQQQVRDPAPPPLGDVLDLLRLIWAVDHALQKASKRMLATVGVTGPQRFVLRIVGRFPGITAGQIARLLHVHPSTLTGILRRLERQGLVKRRRDARDARRSCLGITEDGRRVEDGGRATIEAAIERLVSRMPRAKLESASEVLQALAAALSAWTSAHAGARRELRRLSCTGERRSATPPRIRRHSTSAAPWRIQVRKHFCLSPRVAWTGSDAHP